MGIDHPSTVLIEPAWGRLDYVKITVHEPENCIPMRAGTRATWAELDQALISGSAMLACDVAEDALLLPDDQWWGRWEDRGHGARGVQRVLHAVPGLDVLCYDREWAIIEIKGSMCERVGNPGIARLLGLLEDRQLRWGSSRADMAWDGFPASVETVRESLNGGRFHSQLRPPTPVPYFENDLGRTVYSGKRDAKRLIRWYDKRGPVRIEYELKGDYSTALLQRLAQSEVDVWPEIMMSVLADAIEFGDGDKRGRRVASWWSEFIGDTEGERLAVAPKDTSSLDAVASGDGHLQRYAVVLNALADAYGEQWLIDRIRYWRGKRMVHQKVKRLAAELEKAKGSGLCGVPGPDPEDICPI